MNNLEEVLKFYFQRILLFFTPQLIFSLPSQLSYLIFQNHRALSLKYRLVFLRESSARSPVELVLVDDDGKCTIAILTDGQLQRLAYEAIHKVLRVP